MLKEFREFAVRGNVIDMAVGIIVGVAFGKIVTSLVNDVIMPPLGLLVGSRHFSDLYINLGNQAYPSLEAAKAAGAPTLNYGAFLAAVSDFLIVALVVFLVLRQINRLKRKPAAADPTSKECPHCLSSIPIKATRCAQCTADLAEHGTG